MKAERNITFIEARKIASAESEGRSAQGSRTAAAVVASKSGPTLPVTRSVHAQTQTDLTWPKLQEKPSVLPSSASSTSQQTTQTSEKLSPRRKDTDGTHRSGKRQSTQSPSPSALTCSKYNFNKPHGKPPDKVKKKRRLTRPLKSDSEIPTSNMFQLLSMDTGDGGANHRIRIPESS